MPPAKKPKKRTLVKKRIERAKGVRQTEAVWFKDIKGNLRRIQPSGVTITVLRDGKIKNIRLKLAEEDKITFNIPDFSSHFIVHTYLPEKKRVTASSRRPAWDIISYSKLLALGKVKTEVAVVLDKNGKVAGYNIIKLNKPIPKKLHEVFLRFEEQIVTDVNFFYQRKGRFYLDLKAYNAALRDFLAEHGITLRQHFRPMPNYRLTKRLRFQRRAKRKKKSK